MILGVDQGGQGFRLHLQVTADSRAQLFRQFTRINTNHNISCHVLNAYVPGSVLTTLPVSQIIILIQSCEIDINRLPFSDEETKFSKTTALWKFTQLIDGRAQLETQFFQMHLPSILLCFLTYQDHLDYQDYL